MAFNYIKDIVSRKDPEVYNIICLLFTIISKVSIWCEQGIYYIRFFQSNLDKNGINFNNDKLNVKSVLIRNSEIYKVSHINFPNFSIDKNVLFKIDKEKKNIVFVPNLFQYKLPTGNVIDIEYDSFTFSVPLIWRIFVVNIGEARIKFLFKKRRYQISIKGAAHIKRFVIGNNSISFENNKYHTIYYVPMKIDVESQVYFFNEKGEALNLEKWTYSHSSAGVHGIFLDSYGHLSDEIQFQKNLSKKNMNVKAIANPIDTIPVKDPFYLWIRKGIKYKFSGIPCSKYVQKILECDAILLKMGLTIFFDKTVKERDQILNCFYANFGFLPKSEELENLNLKNYMFNIIVSDKNLGTEISSSILSKEILLKKNGSKKAILISPQNVISWLDNAFYMIN